MIKCEQHQQRDWPCMPNAAGIQDILESKVQLPRQGLQFTYKHLHRGSMTLHPLQKAWDVFVVKALSQEHTG